MKPEYSEQTEDVDLLILAGGFAEGAMRSGLLSKFLVGVAVPPEEGQPRKKFYGLARVSRLWWIRWLCWVCGWRWRWLRLRLWWCWCW